MKLVRPYVHTSGEGLINVIRLLKGLGPSTHHEPLTPTRIQVATGLILLEAACHSPHREYVDSQ